MGNIADSFGFGAESTEADVQEFESTVTGDAKRGAEAEEGHSKDDGSDNAGWDADTDVKDLSGAGKEPKDDDTTGADEQTDEEKAAAKAAEAKAKAKDGDDEDDEPGDLPEGVKKRVARANRARDREKERADTAEREAAELRKQLAEAKPKADDTAPPSADDFDTYEEYLQAKKEHEDKAKPEPKKDEPKPDEGKPDRELVGAVKEIEATLADAGHGDLFKQVVESKDVDVTRDMAIAIAELDNPETVLQAFLDDPKLSKSIADLKTPTARLKALVKLALRYKAPAKGEER
jgi:hypothetical protein